MDYKSSKKAEEKAAKKALKSSGTPSPNAVQISPQATNKSPNQSSSQLHNNDKSHSSPYKKRPRNDEDEWETKRHKHLKEFKERPKNDSILDLQTLNCTLQNQINSLNEQLKEAHDAVDDLQKKLQSQSDASIARIVADRTARETMTRERDQAVEQLRSRDQTIKVLKSRIEQLQLIIHKRNVEIKNEILMELISGNKSISDVKKEISSEMSSMNGDHNVERLNSEINQLNGRTNSDLRDFRSLLERDDSIDRQTS